MRDFLVKISYVAVDGGSKNIEVALNKDNGFNVVNDQLCIKAYADKIRVFVGDAVACENDMVDFNIICAYDMELDLDTGSIKYKFTTVKINYVAVDGTEKQLIAELRYSGRSWKYFSKMQNACIIKYSDYIVIGIDDAIACECGSVIIELHNQDQDQLEIDLDKKIIIDPDVKDKEVYLFGRYFKI